MAAKENGLGWIRAEFSEVVTFVEKGIRCPTRPIGIPDLGEWGSGGRGFESRRPDLPKPKCGNGLCQHCISAFGLAMA